LLVALLSSCADAPDASSKNAGADMPGSDTFPLIAGSTLEECPEAWMASRIPGEKVAQGPACVAVPMDDKSDAIIEGYQKALADRGFLFGRYLDSPSVVMLVRPNGDDCDLMIVGLPYLPPEQRTRLLLNFEVYDATAEGCAKVQREGQG